MNNNQNTASSSMSCEQRKDRGWSNFACIHKVIRNFSALCSFAGASLFGGIFFGLADILNYRNTKLIYECAHYMVVAAVVLFFLAFLLSYFKEDSKQSNPVVATLANVRESAQFENNRIANISANKLNLTGNLKRVQSNTKCKQGIMSENVKTTDTSSKILNFTRMNKEEIVAGTLPLSSSCKNLADQSKQQETANTLPESIPSKTRKPADTYKHGESASILSSDISSKSLPKSSTSEQCDNAKVSSPNISSEMFQHASLSKNTKPRSQSVSDKPSHFNRQLVPYEKNPKIPFYRQSLQTSPRNLYEFMSPNASGYSPVTEITATKRMTVGPWGTQEEYQIHQRTFYHVPESPVGGFSPQYGLRPNLNCDPNNGGVQEYQINQTTFYQHPPYLGGRISSNVSRPKFDNDQNGISSSVFSQPRQNKVSDVLRRFDSMNIFH